MTRLTQSMKQNIVSSVMADIPVKWKKTDIFKNVFDHAVDSLPPAVRKIWDDEKTRGFVKLIHAGHDTIYGWVPGCDERNPLTGDVLETFKTCIQSYKTEQRQRSLMRDELTTALYNIRTIKQFTEHFPELVKYLPEKNEPVKNLPTTTHMIDKLKKMGLKL